jgi:hypothetical protein
MPPYVVIAARFQRDGGFQLARRTVELQMDNCDVLSVAMQRVIEACTCNAGGGIFDSQQRWQEQVEHVGAVSSLFASSCA